MDVYATSKLCMEQTAASFARRFSGVDIYCLRISAVIEPENHARKFEAYLTRPQDFKVHAWSYTDARDLAGMVHKCLQTNGLGFQVFNAVNDETTIPQSEGSIEDWLKKTCPDVPIVQKMGDRDSPVCNKKIKDMLGWKEEFGWRKVMDKE
jgi:nucleoside-diphosphate-sugar epimerase